MNNRFKKILNIIIFVIFLFAMTIKVDVVKAETADHKFSFTAFTCSTLDENNKCKGYKNDGVIEEFDYDNPFVSHGEVIKLGIHYTPGQNKTWDLSTFFNYDKDYVTPIYVNDSLFIEKAEDLNYLYIIDSNDITTEAQIGAIVEDGSTLEENRTYLENEEDLYYVYFKVKDVTPSTTFKFTYDLDEDKTNVSADGTITSEEIEFEIIDKYTVTYPDGKVIIKNPGDILKLPEAWDKDSEVISTVTFKYHNDLEDTTSNVTKGYTLSKWTIDETEYNPGDEITINNDIVLEDSYEEEIINAEFPENPKKPGYKFIGWYTEETGGEKVENYSEDEDIILHAQWQVMDNVHIITPDGEEEVPYGTEYTLGTNDTPKEDETYDVTFKYHDDITGDLVKQVTAKYTPNGWLVNDVHYDDEASFEVTEDVTIEPDYIETVIPAEFPSEPTRENYEFLGWYTEETGGEKIESYSLEADIILHAHWEITLPTDITVDINDLTMVPNDIHQIVVTFIPEGSSDVITYTGYEDTIISVSQDGLITALSKGTTTITVGTENTEISKTITVTVLSDKLESNVYSVLDKVRPKENEDDPDITDRIIIGAEPGTLISDFKSNLDNPSEYIKIYDGDNELSDDDIVKTGLTIRLEVNGTIYDEAIIIIRGDINQDGLVNLMDKSVLSEQLLRLSDIEGYGVYAADIDNNDSINLMDKSKLSEYLLRLIDTLNE